MSEPKIEIWEIEKIKPYALNAKIHGDKQVQKIAESIKRLGWRGNPIVVDEDGIILAGHGRRLAALSLDMKRVPVIQYKSMTEDEKKAFRLADNRVAVSDFDEDMLQQELEAIGLDMDGIFDKKELEFMQVDLGEMTTDAFITDIDAAVREQQHETKQNMEKTAATKIPIAKVLGFKDVLSANEIHVSRFMGRIIGEFGGDPESAFVKFVQQYGGSGE